VRLAEPDRAALVAKGGHVFEPMPGRPMREYVVLPKAVLRDRRALADWIRRGLAHTAAVPAKTAKKRKVARKK
jgi:hypothetical protein